MRDPKKQDAAGNMQMLELLMVREVEACLSGVMSTANVQDFRLLRSPAEAGFLQAEVVRDGRKQQSAPSELQNHRTCGLWFGETCGRLVTATKLDERSILHIRNGVCRND